MHAAGAILLSLVIPVSAAVAAGNLSGDSAGQEPVQNLFFIEQAGREIGLENGTVFSIKYYEPVAGPSYQRVSDEIDGLTRISDTNPDDLKAGYRIQTFKVNTPGSHSYTYCYMNQHLSLTKKFCFQWIFMAR